MEQRRIVRVMEAIAAQPEGYPHQRMCDAAASRLDSPGVAVSLTSGGKRMLETVCSTTDGRVGASLQSDLGEGPAYTAHASGWPVLAPDLGSDVAWPAFSSSAVERGILSAFAFPLRRGALQIGALTLFRPVSGHLHEDHHADALVFARIAMDLLLGLQAGRSTDELDRLFVDGTGHTVEIHQATGIVSVQLGIAVGAALAVLRAHAYTEGRSLREVAIDIVARRLRLDRLD